MGEARRRKLAALSADKPTQDAVLQRANLIALAHEAMAQSDDPTLSGMTLIMPSGETIFLGAPNAKKPGKPNA